MKTFSRITKLKLKDRCGKIESYRIVQADTDDGTSYSIYLEVGAKTYLQFSTQTIEELNHKYQSMLMEAREQGKRYQVCRIL
jgi:hypothetical protein